MVLVYFVHVFGHEWCLLFLTFNSNVFSALLLTFALTYIIIFVNYIKESKMIWIYYM